jgi:hypothetical protein
VSGRLIAGILSTFLVVGAVALVPSQVSAQTVTHHAVARLTPPPCPQGDACVTVPPVCPSGQTCPTVQMGPSTDLGPNQWVYLNMYNFEAGAHLEVAICTDTAPLPTPPLCITNATASLPIANYLVQTFADGSTSISYQLDELSSTDPPFEGAAPGIPTDKGTFLCNLTSPCSIDVIDTGPQGTGPAVATDSNTAVLPFTFAPPNNGCPTATTVNSESEFGIDVLLPVQARMSCASSQPTFAFNTAIDGLSALTDLSNGETQIAFSDNPEEADQQAILTAGQFAMIPVALSANVISFKAQMSANQNLYPDSSLELTPAMAAGLLTTAYQTPQNSDMIDCPTSGCQQPPCIPKLKGTPGPPQCSLFTQLNYVPGFIAPQSYAGFVRSDNAGTTGQLFDWICHATNKPVAALGQTWSETQTPAQVVEAGLTLSPTAKPLKTCPNSDQFPPVPSGVTAYTSYSDPSQQALKMTAYVGPGLGGANINGAFGAMNWADAEYFGLSVAGLENSSGNFELPTESSLDAAVPQASANADGSIPVPATAPTAYPMASIIYAIVPTGTYTATDAANVKEFLTQLLNLTGGSQSSDLPSGFVPLPSWLYQQAQTDLAADVHTGTAGSTTGSTGSGGGGSTGSGSTSGSTTGGGGSGGNTATTGGRSVSGSGSGGSSPVVIVRHPNGPGPQILKTTPVTTAKTGKTGGNTKARGPIQSFLLEADPSRALVPGALLLGLLALLLGSALLWSRGLRESMILSLRSLRSKLPDRPRPTTPRTKSLRNWFAGKSRQW